MKTLELLKDANGRTILVIPLSDPQDVDGTSASAVCANPIDSNLCRILSLDNALRIAIGPSPVGSPLEATATGIALAAGAEIYQPCNEGDYVAVLGGKANICTCGK